MTQDSRLGPELLKQNGIDQQQLLSEEHAAIRELLRRERRRAQVLKRISLASFAMIPVCIVIIVLYSGSTAPADNSFVPVLAPLTFVLPYPAFLVGCVTALLAMFFSRSADRQELLTHLAQIESVLRQLQANEKLNPEPRNTP